MMAVFPAVFTAGLTFAIGQFTVSNFVGPELTDTLAALFSLASVARAAEVLAAERRLRRRHGDGDAGRNDSRHAATRRARVCDLRHPRRHGADRPEWATSPACRRSSRPGTSPRCCAAARRVMRSVPSRGLDQQRRRRRSRSASRCGTSAGRAPTTWSTASRCRSCSARRRSWRKRLPMPLTYRLDFLAAAGTLVLLATFVALIPMIAAGARPGYSRRRVWQDDRRSYGCRSSPSPSFSRSRR